MSELVLAVGLVLAVEGFICAAFPNAAKRMMAQALQMPDQVLRMAGLAALSAGVFSVWLVR